MCVTPINPAYTAPEINRQLKSSSAKVIFSHASISDKVTAVLHLQPESLTTIVIGEDKIPNPESSMKWKDFLRLSSSSYPVQAEIDIKEDLALLPFSSGTTGLPKVSFCPAVPIAGYL